MLSSESIMKPGEFDLLTAQGGFRCLFRVQNSMFNESPSGRSWPCKKHRLSLVYFRDLFCQYEIEMWAFPHKETARSLRLGRLLHCG